MRIQFWHILVLLLVVLILFGAKRLPDVASSIGKSLKIFKKEVTELREDDKPAPPADQTYASTADAGGSHRAADDPRPGYPPPGPPDGVRSPSSGPADPEPRR